MVSVTERRSRKYGFASIGSMAIFFSKWIPEDEIRRLIEEAETDFHPRSGSSQEETRLQKIQKAEFLVVRRLVHRNPAIA